MKRSSVPLLFLALLPIWGCAGGPSSAASPGPTGDSEDTSGEAEEGMKPYGEVITADAETDEGLFSVHSRWSYNPGSPRPLMAPVMAGVSRTSPWWPGNESATGSFFAE